MKPLIVLLWALLALFLCFSVSAQDIIYTISGEIDSQKTPLDSISFENLTNQTHMGFGDLPERDDYRINLTTNEYWGSTSVSDLLNTSCLFLVKNLSGMLAVSYRGQTAVDAAIALYNTKGQRLTYKENQELENGSLIEVKIGNAGIYFLTISTHDERRTFKATGKITGGEMSIATLSGTALPFKSGTVYSIAGTDTQKGDNVKVSVFKLGYVAQPIELTVEGNETLTFPLEAQTPPEIETLEATNILSNSATLNGNIVYDGNSPITELGFYWSATNQNPGEADSIIVVEVTTGNFSTEFTGLNYETTYYVRAYAINSQGAAYGEQIAFTTESWQRDTQTAVVDVTNPATGKTWMDRNLGASRAATSSTDEEAYGDLYQWGRAADGHQKRNSPTTSTPINSDDPGHGNFILAPYDHNDWRSPQNDNLWQGVSGTNNPCPDGYRLPTSEEWDAERKSWGSNNSAGAFSSFLKLPMAGSRDNNGLLDYLSTYGIYWSTTVQGNRISFLYFFSSDATAANNVRATGNSVRCIKDVANQASLPTVTTTAITNITQTTATSGGNITSDGGTNITARGVCWNTTGNPTIADNKTNDGTSAGTFNSSITGLTANNTYYVRAYATNSQGTAYGQTIEFTTLVTALLTVTTTNTANITQTTATSGGNVTSDGEATVTARGVCWNTTGNPTIADSKTTNGTGTGSWVSQLVELQLNTTYYVRAYATNSQETAYGIQVIFKTFNEGEELWQKDTETSVVDVTNPATGKTWMDRNLGASHAATSSTDAEAYGDLYQWGRAADGHQKRNSPTVSTLSNSDNPGHGNFILNRTFAKWGWRSPQNDYMWQGINGTNNPCPSGYRLPTEAEWVDERRSLNSYDVTGAFASPLKLPVAGDRSYYSGSLDDVGSSGNYWSSTVDDVYSRFFYFGIGNAGTSFSDPAYGRSVRCIKD